MEIRLYFLCLAGMFFSLGEGFISVHEGVDKALIASGIVKQLERDILSGDRMRFSAPDVEVQIAGDKTVADKTEPTKPDGYIEGLDNENKWAGLENVRTMDGNMPNADNSNDENVNDDNMRFSSPDAEVSDDDVSDLKAKAKQVQQNAAVMEEKANSERAALKDQETQLDKELQETEDQIVSMKATIEQQKSALRGALSKEAEKK